MSDGLLSCYKCKQRLPRELFHKCSTKSRRSGNSSACKACTSIRNRERRWRNKAVVREAVYQYYLSNPCVDCGEVNPLKLTFDHIQEKRYSISDIICEGKSLNTVFSEIKKCEVRCFNCHMERSAEQLNFWIWRRHCGYSV